MVGDEGLETSDLLWLKQTSLDTIKRSPQRLTGNTILLGKLARLFPLYTLISSGHSLGYISLFYIMVRLLGALTGNRPKSRLEVLVSFHETRQKSHTRVTP
jgi:hypothetical protein